MEPVTGNVCHICGKIYQRPGCLEPHIRCVHMGERRPWFQCSFCLKKFQSNTNRLMHERKMHPAQSGGDAAFASTSHGTPPRPAPPTLPRQHPTGEHGHRQPGGQKKSPWQFRCSECPQLFDLQFALRKHYQRAHRRPPFRVKKEPAEPEAIHVVDTDEDSVIKAEVPFPNRHAGEPAVPRPRNNAASMSRRGVEPADLAQENGDEEYLEQEVLQAKQDLVKAKGQLVRANKALVLSRRELVESKKELLELKVRLAAKRGQRPVAGQNPHSRQFPYPEYAEAKHGNRQTNPKTRPAQSRANGTLSSTNVTPARNSPPLPNKKDIPNRSQTVKRSFLPEKVSDRTIKRSPLAIQAARRSVTTPHRSVAQTPDHRQLTLSKSAPMRVKELPTPASRNPNPPASARCIPFHRTSPTSSPANSQSSVRPSNESSHRSASAFHSVMPKTEPAVEPSERSVNKYDTVKDRQNSHQNPMAHDLVDEEDMHMDTYHEAQEEASAIFRLFYGEAEADPNSIGESEPRPGASQFGGNLSSNVLDPRPGTSGLSENFSETPGMQRRYVRSDSMCKCEYCGKQFATLSTAIVHRRIHTGERPYECCYCNKKFRSKVALTSHTRTHTKPLICNICCMRFAETVQLRNHIMQYHPRQQ